MIIITLLKDNKTIAIYYYSDDDYADGYEQIKNELEISGELVYEDDGEEEEYNAWCGDIEFTHQYVDGLDLIYKAD